MALATVGPMARKKAEPPKAEASNQSLASLRGSEAMGVWLDGLAKKVDASTRAHLLRKALKALAAAEKYTPPPED